jgi:hypothetical protein
MKRENRWKKRERRKRGNKRLAYLQLRTLIKECGKTVDWDLESITQASRPGRENTCKKYFFNGNIINVTLMLMFALRSN